ncbi:hypothetical protein ACFE04_031696 [Oxalis oulophora]
MGSAQINVTKFGAVGDGKTDDSKAFEKAWDTVCQTASGNPTLVIPAGKTFLTNPIAFKGPCKASSVKVQILGNLVAPTTVGVYDVFDREHWIMFSQVNGLHVEGKGQIDGKGNSWWAACKTITDSCKRPTIMTFNGCDDLVVNGLNTVNSQRNHISIGNCDDCIAVGTGISALNITRVNCGPGHGISVGSLGRNGESAEVEGVFVSDCTLTGTQNGVRIKTVQGGSGYARNIRFTNITLVDSDHPIIIDQYYCPHSTCASKASDVRVSDVYYNGIHGTSTRLAAISLQCSKAFGCKNINLNNINITASAQSVHPIVEDGETATLVANCTNAHGKASKTTPAVTCLLP